MILNIKSPSLLYNERRQRQRQWHQWFAWYPVRLTSTKVVWLQKVYRRTNYYVDEWEFSFIDPLEETNV